VIGQAPIHERSGCASLLQLAERWLQRLVDLVRRHGLPTLQPIYQIVQLGVLVHVADESGPFLLRRDLHRSRDLSPLCFKLRNRSRLLIIR
jgi:hypothetical protein